MRREHVGNVLPLPVLEPIEVRGERGARKVLTRHPDERASEVRQPWRARLVRENAGVERLWQPLPRASRQAIREVQTLEIDYNAQLYRDALRAPRGTRVSVVRPGLGGWWGLG